MMNAVDRVSWAPGLTQDEVFQELQESISNWNEQGWRLISVVTIPKNTDLLLFYARG